MVYNLNMQTVEAVEASLDSWTETGRALLRCDPLQFGELLLLARRFVKVHADPLSVSLEECGPIS